MPLLAIGEDGSRHPAWALSSSEWGELKERYRALGLHASCCGADVVPVTSTLGTQFFRHTPAAGCSHHESAEHIVSKTICARAAQALGFDVSTEARGPDGEWVADVLVRHSTGWAVALEIQLARIPLEEIERRQDRYQSAGVRGAWLLGYELPDAEQSRALPMFRLFAHHGGRIAPAVSVPRFAPLIGLADFTTRLLTKQVRFVEPPARTREVSVVAAQNRCWRCHQDHDMLVGLRNVPPNEMFCPDGFLPARHLGKMPEVWALYRAALPKLLKACPDLTVIRPARQSSSPADLRAHCPLCEAPSSLERLPKTLYHATNHRCWTLAGEPWMPGEHVPPHWSWER